jgi:ribosomal protein S18 acetylase RimI-like enzyme
MSLFPIIRPAVAADATGIKQLMSYPDRAHRHLDWSSPIERLGEANFLVIEQDQMIQAALSCPVDPENVAWIRFFAVQPGNSLNDSFRELFTKMIGCYAQPPEFIISVAVQGWFLRLLMEQGFSLHQSIVVLQVDPFTVDLPAEDPKLTIRQVLPQDLPIVAQIDHLAFSLIWRYSENDIKAAYANSAYATIALFEEQVVGYQFSSASVFSGHLTRLAVLPAYQGMGFGRQLTADVIRYFIQTGAGTITVNTQSDNASSLKVYRQLGFALTGEKFPVMRYKA